MALMTYASGADGPADRGEIFVDPPAYAIVNPVASGLVNLGLVLPLADLSAHRGRLEELFDARVRQLAGLRTRFPRLARAAPVQALGPLAYRVAPPRHGGVMLVGDAAGFYDPFTGEGIFAALRGAELAADTACAALARSDCSAEALAAYGRTRRAAFHRPAVGGQCPRARVRAPPRAPLAGDGRVRRLRAAACAPRPARSGGLAAAPLTARAGNEVREVDARLTGLGIYSLLIDA